MIVTSRLPTLSAVLTAGILAVRYALAGFWLWAVLSILLGLLWWLEIRQHQSRSVHWLLIGFLGIALTGLHIGLGAGWMLCSIIVSLSTWNLHHFSNRFQFAQQNEAAESLAAKPYPKITDR
jgi:hypothetical protein